MWLCVVLSPVLWFFSLSPAIPGLVGKILAVPLAALEMIGTVAKCFSLVVRLCANMMSGHTLLAILMVFVFQAVGAFLQTRATGLFYIGPAAVAAAVAVSMLELLVAVLQAYIFTFLTAMFLGLYVTGSH
jgi:F-type H+-transporting ATPase subunit a